MGWNYLSIPKLQRLHRWSLGMDKYFHPTHYNGCNYLSMLGLKLNHVSKRGHRWARLWHFRKYYCQTWQRSVINNKCRCLCIGVMTQIKDICIFRRKLLGGTVNTLAKVTPNDLMRCSEKKRLTCHMNFEEIDEQMFNQYNFWNF